MSRVDVPALYADVMGRVLAGSKPWFTAEGHSEQTVKRLQEVVGSGGSLLAHALS